MTEYPRDYYPDDDINPTLYQAIKLISDGAVLSDKLEDRPDIFRKYPAKWGISGKGDYVGFQAMQYRPSPAWVIAQAPYWEFS